jgi:hypothetical protein
VEAVAIASTGDMPRASIPVETARVQSATLYLLPARSAGVKSPAYATEAFILH